MIQKSSKSKTSINLRLLLTTFVVVAIAAPAIYFWHARSVTRISQTFLTNAEAKIEQADQNQASGKIADADERLQEAVELIWQYRRIRPEDAASAVLLAETFDRSPQGKANRTRSAELYVEALARSDGNDTQNLRLRAAEVYLESGNYANAEKIVLKLKAGTNENTGQKPSQPEADFRARVSKTYVMALVGQLVRNNWADGSNDELGTEIAKALEDNPRDTELPMILASLFRNPEWHEYLSEAQRHQLIVEDKSVSAMSAQSADEIVDNMVRMNLEPLNVSNDASADSTEGDNNTDANTATQNLAQAYFRRFLYRSKYRIDGAEDDLRLAGKYNSDDTDIAFQQGLLLLQRFQKETVASGTTASLNDDQTQQLEKAKTFFAKCVENNPDQLLAHLYLGDIQLLLGDSEDALASWTVALDRALELKSDIPFLASCYGRLIGNLIDLDRTEKAREHLDSMEKTIRQYSVRTGDPRIMSELVQSQRLMRGALQFKNRSYAEAISTLEQALANRQPQSAIQTIGIIRKLGTIYTQLGQPSRAANVYKIATEIDGSNRTFRLLLSQAYLKGGQFALAADAFGPLVRSDDASAEDWLEFSRLLYLREANIPKQARRWQAFNIAIGKSEQLSLDSKADLSWRLDMLKLQYGLAESVSNPPSGEGASGLVATSEMVKKLEAMAGDDVDRIKHLVLLHERIGNSDDAKRWLKKYDDLIGEQPERYIFHAELLANGNQRAAAAVVLKEGLSRVDDDQKQELHLAQVNLMLSAGEFEQALTKLETVVKQNPNSPELVMKLAELVIQLPDQIKSDPSPWELQLKDLEGANGPYTNFLKAQRALIKFQETDDASLRDRSLNAAVNLAREVIRIRPNWAAAHSLTGLVYQVRRQWTIEKYRINPVLSTDELAQQLEKQRGLALGFFQKAVELGERRSGVLLRMVELDPSLRGQLLSLLDPQRIEGNQRLTNMEMSSLVANNDLGNAQKAAVRATVARPSDPLAWLSRAQIEVISESVSDAEHSMKKAKELASGSDDPQRILKGLFAVALFGQQYSSTTNAKQKWKSKARALQEEILKLADADDRQAMEAMLLASIGDDNAGEFLLRAEKQDPDNIDLLKAALQYSLTRDASDSKALDESIRVANRLLVLNPNNSGFRGLLSQLLAQRGSVNDWQLLETLWDDQALKSISADISTQRAYAVLLLAKRDVPNPERLTNLEKADAIVRESVLAFNLTLRGQILREWSELLVINNDEKLRQKKMDQAAECFVQAAEAIDVKSNQLYKIINFFIEQEQWETEHPEWETRLQRLEIADFYLGKLNSIMDSSIAALDPYTALQAQLMYQQSLESGSDDSQRIVDLVESFGDKVAAIKSLPKPTRARYFQRVASILESVEATPELVSKWQQNAIEQDQAQRMSLAIRLAKDGELEQALDECLAGYEESSLPKFAIASASFLLTGDAEPSHFEKMEPMFQSALKNFPTNTALISGIASVRFAGQNQVEEAIELYELALKVDPRNLSLLNNLATAYAELPDLPKAFQVIDSAIRMHGERAALVDTRAVIWMLQDKLDQAESDLRKVLNQNSDPRFWCHLAEVMWKQFEKSNDVKDLNEARSALDKSLNMDLEKQVFTMGEKKRLAMLRKNLGSSVKSTVSGSHP